MNYDNLLVNNLELQLTDINFDNNNISAVLTHLSANEISGFRLDNLTSKRIFISNTNYISAVNLNILTPNSKLILDILFQYEDAQAFDDFVNKVKLTTNIYGSNLGLKDLAFFSNELYGLDQDIWFKCKTKGIINDLKIRDFNLHYETFTRISGDFNLKDITDNKNMLFFAKIDNLSSSVKEISQFHLPNANAITLPDELSQMGIVRANGIIKGKLEDFVCEMNVNSEMGDADFNLHIVNENLDQNILYQGKLAADKFNIGKILKVPDLGDISFAFEVDGQGTDDEASLTVDGTITALAYNAYNYSGITINGNMQDKIFIGDVRVNDPNISFDLNGIINRGDSIPSYDLTLKLNNANLKTLNLSDRDSTASLNAYMKLNFKGNNIDNMLGSINAYYIDYYEKHVRYTVNDMNLLVEKQGDDKTLKLRSEILDVDINGKFIFSQITQSIDMFIKDYLPSMRIRKDEEASLIALEEQKFAYKINLKDAQILLDLFMPDLQISTNVEIKGKYNSLYNTFDINASSKHITYKDMACSNLFLTGETYNSNIYMNIGSEHVYLSDNLGLENLHLNVTAYDDSVNYNLFWDNKEIKHANSGDIRGY